MNNVKIPAKYMDMTISQAVLEYRAATTPQKRRTIQTALSMARDKIRQIHAYAERQLTGQKSVMYDVPAYERALALAKADLRLIGLALPE